MEVAEKSVKGSFNNYVDKKGGGTDKRTDVWSRNFMIWKINFGLWAAALAG